MRIQPVSENAASILNIAAKSLSDSHASGVRLAKQVDVLAGLALLRIVEDRPLERHRVDAVGDDQMRQPVGCAKA